MKRINVLLLAFLAAALAVIAGMAVSDSFARPALAIEDEPFYENNGWFLMHKRTSLKLEGKADWCDTHVQLIPGQELRVVANGSISFKTDFNRTSLERRGPAGDKDTKMEAKGVDGINYYKAKLPAPELTPFALVGRIIALNGEVKGKPFEIGADTVMPVPAEGQLQITSNDDSHYDNKGAWAVTILTRKMPANSVEPFGKEKPKE
ncbi:MAG TPA: hypothetical protein VL860_04135 [Planctomycetota bacterium]|nr:hypothetical protein [Planctomycetota bacterium]